jgi:hypothetical protein
MKRYLLLFAVLAVALVAGRAWGQIPPPTGAPIRHDPWLNWDFFNLTGQDAFDLDIVVDSPTFVPPQWWADAFPNIQIFNNQPAGDTTIRFFGGVVPPGAPAHGGVYMAGSGIVRDAYWTDAAGQKLGLSLPIIYEQTRIDLIPDVPGTAAVWMELQVAPGFFADNPDMMVGMTDVQTFMNIPSDMLGLEDLNRDLDLAELAPYMAQAPFDIPLGMLNDDEVFEVFLGTTRQLGGKWESLLTGNVWFGPGDSVPPTQGGIFWNLNPQSPEPVTLVGLGIGAVGLVRYLRRRR